MRLKPIHRRTPWPARPFEHHELGMMLGTTLGAYLLLVGMPYLWVLEHTGGRAHEIVASNAVGWALFGALAPFWVAFRRVWIRLLRTPKPKRTTAEIEESPAEISAWASSVLDKRKQS